LTSNRRSAYFLVVVILIGATWRVQGFNGLAAALALAALFACTVMTGIALICLLNRPARSHG
jgi:hypothetical protein